MYKIKNFDYLIFLHMVFIPVHYFFVYYQKIYKLWGLKMKNWVVYMLANCLYLLFFKLIRFLRFYYFRLAVLYNSCGNVEFSALILLVIFYLLDKDNPKF